MQPPYACGNCGDLGWVEICSAHPVWPAWGVCPDCKNPKGEPMP
jgi:hypothetical protein